MEKWEKEKKKKKKKEKKKGKRKGEKEPLGGGGVDIQNMIVTSKDAK